MASLTYADQGVRAGAASPGPVERLRTLRARYVAAAKARRDFESLRGASDHLLSDIGLTRADVERALAAPFWADPGDLLRHRGR